MMRFFAEQNVVRDTQMGSKIQLLVNHGDAAAASVQRVPGNERLTVQLKPPAVRLASATEDSHQGAFAGPVLADERVHLAGGHFERNISQRMRGAETFSHARHSQAGRHSFRYLAMGG